MTNFSNNLYRGILHRIKRTFHRPYAKFNIGWVKEKVLKHQVGKEVKYHLYQGKYKIAFTDGPTFLLSIHELFISEFYKFRAEKPAPRIIDCGSYIGTSLLYFKVNYPDAIITGFEPDVANYSILQLNLSNWNFSEVTVVNAAIWTTNGSISFNSAGNMSSRIAVDAQEDSKDLVKCVRLKDLLNEEIDFLKIDIEGAESSVLKDCSDNLGNVKNLFVEYHGKYDQIVKLNEILDILHHNNFKYYIKEGISIYARPFWDKDKVGEYDLLLNIFAFRN
jgi:FkbM family methyltransferase